MTAAAHERSPRRAADPYRDLAVIDARAPRTNQTVVAVLAAVGLATGWWPLLALVALQLTLAVTLGRRFCLPCLLYFEVIQPLVGEGPLEDSRPVRFANQVGAAFLWAASVAFASGAPRLGAVLGWTVAALAFFAATTGLCAGCALYRLRARLRGGPARRGRAVDDLDPVGSEAGGEAVGLLTHPVCAECQTLAGPLERSGRAPIEPPTSSGPSPSPRGTSSARSP